MTDFIGVTKLMLGKLLEYLGKREVEKGYEKLYPAAEKWGYGPIIATIERLNKFEKSVNYNINNAILTDGVLFAVMEEKTKWQKL